MNEPLTEKVFRFRLWYRVSYVVTLLSSIGINVFFLHLIFKKSGSFTSPAVIAALIFGAAGIIFTVLSVWVGLVYWRRMRLVLSDQSITNVDAFEINHISVDAISHINWLSMSDEIIVESPPSRIRINLGFFKRTDQHEIITFLRNAVPVEQQEKWESFTEMNRRSVDVFAKRTRGEQLLLGLFFVLAGLYGYMWWMESGFPYLLAATVFLFSGITRYRST